MLSERARGQQCRSVVFARDSTRAQTPPGRSAGRRASLGKGPEEGGGEGEVRVALASGEDGHPERQGETINASCSIDEIEMK